MVAGLVNILTRLLDIDIGGIAVSVTQVYDGTLPPFSFIVK